LFGIPFFIYFFYRTSSFTLGLIFGYIRYRKENKVEWYKELLKITSGHSGGNLPEHLIVIPVYKEDFSIISRNIDSIVNQKYSIKNIHLSVTIEEQDSYENIKQNLLNKYEKIFDSRLLITQHILKEGEVKGAASNRTFGAKSYVQKLLQNGQSLDKFLITSPDADTVFTENYFARVSLAWIKDNYSKNKFYQTAMYKFGNNLWEVPILIRALSNGLSLSVLSSSAIDGRNRFTFSCFSLAISTLVDAKYWDTTIAIDDTPLHWRIFDYTQGNWSCCVIYEPINLDAINSSDYLLTHIKQYHQYYRWGWGIIAFPIALKAINKNNTNLLNKFYKLWKLIEIFIVSKVFPVVTSIYLLLISYSNLNSVMLDLISVITNLNFFIVLPVIYIKFQMLRESSNIKYIGLIGSILIELPLGVICLLTYGIFPYVYAALGFALGAEHENKIKWSMKKSVIGSEVRVMGTNSELAINN